MVLGDDFRIRRILALLGSTVDTCLRQFTEAFMVQTAENCGVSAVAVPSWSSIFLVVVQRPIPMVILIIDPQFVFDMVIDVPVCRSCSFFPFVCRGRFPWSRLFVGPHGGLGISRISLREGGPRIPRSILPFPGGCRTNFTLFLCEGGHTPEVDLVLLAVCIHVHASVYDRFWKNSHYFPDEFVLGS